MKLLTLIALVIFISSCGNDSGQAKIYEDSAIYYSNMLANATDSGYTGYDSIDFPRKTRIKIYQIKRQHFIDKMKEEK